MPQTHASKTLEVKLTSRFTSKHREISDTERISITQLLQNLGSHEKSWPLQCREVTSTPISFTANLSHDCPPTQVQFAALDAIRWSREACHTDISDAWSRRKGKVRKMPLCSRKHANDATARTLMCSVKCPWPQCSLADEQRRKTPTETHQRVSLSRRLMRLCLDSAPPRRIMWSCASHPCWKIGSGNSPREGYSSATDFGCSTFEDLLVHCHRPAREFSTVQKVQAIATVSMIEEHLWLESSENWFLTLTWWQSQSYGLPCTSLSWCAETPPAFLAWAERHSHVRYPKWEISTKLIKKAISNV